MTTMTFKIGDKVHHQGIEGTEWMPVTEAGYTGKVIKVFKNGKVAIEFERGKHWLCQSYAHGVIHCNPKNLTLIA